LDYYFTYNYALIIIKFVVKKESKKNDLPAIKNCFEVLLKSTGENLARESLKSTPLRAAKAFQFLTSGYHQNIREIVNDAIFPNDTKEIVLVKNIEFFSICEHHILPFIGKCHVGYIPNGKVLGLSKIIRIVNMFARRLQIQESLTQQVAKAIAEVTSSQDVAVFMEAKHLCMMMRGVEKHDPTMVTSVMLGKFKTDLPTSAKFLELIK
jgi:GTP cyclohydrolase I